ncbi:MAG: FeoB-associated Cys-rich membrane protein [Clostridia bacterium]|nr:FeoB-associated Cys-rich membrane protein [Clostridia bacterium]
MANVIVILVVLLILGLAALYIVRAKKRGETCVGCPYAKECAAKRSGCGCSGK